MPRIIGGLTLLLCLSLVVSDEHRRNFPSNRNRKRTTSDPMPDLFSEIGDLFLVVDKAIAGQTQQKVEHTNNLASQIFRPRSDYFNRIQRNYQDVQKRLGNIVGNTLGHRNTYSEHELSTVGPPIVTTMKADYTTPAPKISTENIFPAAGKRKRIIPKRPLKTSSRNIQCSKEVLADPVLEKLRQEKCGPIRIQKQDGVPKDFEDAREVLLPLGAKAVDEISKTVFRGLESLSDALSSKPDADGSVTTDTKLSLDYNPFEAADKEKKMNECSNEILADPELEKIRLKKCERIAIKKQTEAIRKFAKDANEILLPLGKTAVDEISKSVFRGLNELSGDQSLLSKVALSNANKGLKSSSTLEDECTNEILTDATLEQQRKEKCARVTAEEQVKTNFQRFLSDSVKTNEALMADGSRASDHLSKGLLKRLGEVSSEQQKISSEPEECSNEVVADPILEELRKEKCARIAKNNRKNFEQFVEDTQRASEILLPFGTKVVDQISKTFFSGIEELSSGLSKLSDNKENSKSSSTLEYGCTNEVLTDPVLEQQRKEKCSRIAAEEQVRKNFQKFLSDSVKASETLMADGSRALDHLSKGLLGRLGEVSSEKHKLTEECSKEVVADPVLERHRREKCARIAKEETTRNDLEKIIEDSRRATEMLLPLSSKQIDKLSNVLIRRSGDLEANTDGRIIGDVLYSESFFDKHMRQLLRDHGRWILDNPLLNRLRETFKDNAEISDARSSTATMERSSDDKTTETTTTTETAKRTEFHLPLSKSGDSLPENPYKSSYYRVFDNGDVVEEEVDIVLQPHANSGNIEVEEAEQEPRDTVILAFTVDGVPLKLRMGPEIHNPISYLHNVLRSAGVSLNIPVESYDDLEPVGKEVYKVGSGLLTRAVLINMSDNNELKSLLRTLVTSKTAGKTVLS